MRAHKNGLHHAVFGAMAALAISAATSFTAWADTEVRVIATGEPYGAAMKKAAEIYKQRTGVTITVDQYPYSEAYNKEALLGSSASDEYDIMVLDCIWLPLFVKKQHWVQPFDPLEAAAKQKIDWNGFVPGIVDAHDRFNGTYYAAPIDFFIEVRPIVRLSTRPASAAPKTWDEFRAYAEKLNQPDKSIYGVVTMPGEAGCRLSEWTVRLARPPMPPDANQFVWDKSFKSALTHEDNGRQALDLWLDIKPFVAPGANEMGYAESTNACRATARCSSSRA
jgi:sorbitol/mannitol transport system substrate-binding protein